MLEQDTLKLIKQAKAHDPDSFTGLMQLYMKDMYRTAIAILGNDADCADAVQDTILACWEKIGTLRESRFFRTWLTRILINKCYDIKKQQENKFPLEQWRESPAAAPNSDLKEMLSVLDEKYRLPMMLFYGQGYPTAEIAELLCLPKSTVQTRLARGRQKLAAYYESEV